MSIQLEGIVVGPPNAAAVHKLLSLPDLDHGLALLQCFFARRPRRLAMRSADEDEDAILPDGNITQPVHDGNPDQPVPFVAVLRNGEQRLQSQWCVGYICEGLYGFPFEVVASRPGKHHDGAGLGTSNSVHGSKDVQRAVRQRDVNGTLLLDQVIDGHGGFLYT